MAAGPLLFFSLAARVLASLARFNAGFLDCFRRINAVPLRHIATLPMSLSTITFTGTLSQQGVPVDQMRLSVELAEEMGEAYEFTLDCDEAKAAAAAAAAPKRKRDGSKRFRYQLPLKRNGKSLKLFHNGSVHATGCTSPLEFLDMMDALQRFIAETSDAQVWLVDFDIQLINTLFLVVDPLSGRPLTIAPGALLKHLSAQQRADFDTERHPSVKIPLLLDDAKAATVCVFQTGSISIMGAKRPEHVAAAYEMVCAALDECAPSVCAPDPAVAMRTTTAKQTLNLVDGYPFNLHACCQKV